MATDDGASIKPRLNVPQTTAQNPAARADDGAELLVQHGLRCALEGRTNELGLASIARPANATLH